MIKVFGAWDGYWGWRVEWVENGRLMTKDFYQSDLKPGIDKEAADTFMLSLTESKVA
jgi:hypothetical protein